MPGFSKTPTTQNTVLSDLNEILTGYYINGEKWFDNEAKKQHDMRMGQVSLDQYNDVVGKAKVMASAFVTFAKTHTWKLPVRAVAWTARPGSATRFVGKPVDQKENPSDLIIKFSRGPYDGFLGLSAKATKGKGDIGFKNPGLGTFEKALNMKLYPILDKQVDAAIKKYKLADSGPTRKVQIRANKLIQKHTQEIGAKVLKDLRDELFKKLSRMDNKKLYTFITDHLMDATNRYPKYIKVTGHGNKAPYNATVVDPTKNEKLDALAHGKIKVERVGENGVGFSVNGKKILKCRFKFESEPLATSLKSSVEPW